MQNKPYRSLGVVATLLVASSIEEYDQLAERVGAALDDANDNTVYRGSLADFRTAFCEELEKETGIARKREPVLDKEGNPVKNEDGSPKMKYAQTEAEYVNSVVAEKGFDDASPFQPIADKVAAGIKFDPKARPQGSGAAKLAKVYTEAADKIVAMGEAAVSAAAAKLSAAIGAPVAATRDGIAAGIKAREDKKRASLVSDLVAG